MGIGIWIEERSWGDLYGLLIRKASLGEGLSGVRIEGRPCEDLYCLYDCIAFGGSRVKDRRKILGKFVLFTPL